MPTSTDQAFIATRVVLLLASFCAASLASVAFVLACPGQPAQAALLRAPPQEFADPVRGLGAFFLLLVLAMAVQDVLAHLRVAQGLDRTPRLIPMYWSDIAGRPSTVEAPSHVRWWLFYPAGLIAAVSILWTTLPLAPPPC